MLQILRISCCLLMTLVFSALT